MSRVTECQPDDNSIVGSIHPNADYLDRFQISCKPGQYTSVDEVASDWFVKQPAWIRLLSTNTVTKKGVTQAIENGGYSEGSSVGSWKVIDRDDQEIVFGDSMGFMEYRFSLRLQDNNQLVEGATSVQYLWRRAGKFYFALVKPMHRLFIQYLLKKTVA